MAEREPVEDHRIGAHGANLLEREGVAEEIALGEHDPLGIAGGAGRKDDGCQVVGLQAGFAAGQVRLHGRCRVSATLQEALPANFVRDAEQVGQGGADFLDFRILICIGHEDETHAGIVELETDLLGAERRVQGDVDGAGDENRHVGDQPLDAILRQDCDAVARLNAVQNQAGGTGENLISNT